MNIMSQTASEDMGSEHGSDIRSLPGNADVAPPITSPLSQAGHNGLTVVDDTIFLSRSFQDPPEGCWDPQVMREVSFAIRFGRRKEPHNPMGGELNY